MDNTIDALFEERDLPPLSWCSSSGERNLDCLPDYLTPSENCPVCGAVYVELLDIGFETPRPIPGLFHPEECIVTLHPRAVPPVAVMLLCYSDHRIEYDARIRRLRQHVPRWSDVSVSVAPFGVVYAMMRGGRKK